MGIDYNTLLVYSQGFSLVNISHTTTNPFSCAWLLIYLVPCGIGTYQTYTKTFIVP